MNIEKTNRIEWVDLAKGATILLVIMGHTASAHIADLYSFHMPLFAILTGITIRIPQAKTEI